MISKHVGYYFGSKLFAAILNLVSMALFVRFGGHIVYGGYVVKMAWAAIIYSLTLQWMRFAFFSSYREADSEKQIANYLRTLALGMLLFGIATICARYYGLIAPEPAIAVYVIVTGLAAYDAMHEIARIRLQARTVAIGVLTRSILILLFGVIALILHPTALALALAFGAAHWGGALALSGSSAIMGVFKAPWSMETVRGLLRSGRPLIPAFAVDSFGLQFDRLQLAKHAGLADVGPYGAISDFIRQLMVVGSEAISGAYMALARADAVAGRQEDARQMLGQAFRAYAMLTAFGTAFVWHFSMPLFTLIFGKDIAVTVQPILLIVLLTNAIMVFRAYYFSQILFVDNGGKLLLSANVLHAVVAASLALLIIPHYGAVGAALSLMMGHAVALLWYLWSWRDHYVTRMPYRDAALIALSALVTLALMTGVDHGLGASTLTHVLNLALYGAIAFATAWQFRILAIDDISKAIWRRIADRMQGSAT